MINYNYCNLVLMFIVLFMIIFYIHICNNSLKKSIESFNIVSGCKDIERVITTDFNTNLVWNYDNSLLGEGKKAFVYGGYTDIDGVKVLLAIKKFKDYVKPEKLREEAENQLYASSYGLAPRVYDAFICDDEAFLITDRIDTNVPKYISSFEKGSERQKDALNYIKEKVKQLLTDSNDAGILHTDRHIDNIMIILNGTDYPDVTMIDWDAAKYIELDQDKLNDILYKMDLTFDLLERNLQSNSTNIKVPEGPSKKKYKSLTTVKKIPFGRLFDESKNDSPLKRMVLSEPKIKNSQGLNQFPFIIESQKVNNLAFPEMDQMDEYSMNDLTPVKLNLNKSPFSSSNKKRSIKMSEFDEIPEMDTSDGYISPVKNFLGLINPDVDESPLKVKKFDLDDDF
jgi:hypothetical protein